jgi:hypothetical protein
MAFYESSKVKERLSIRSADSTFDTIIGNLGTQADSEIVEKIRTARKERKLSSLPEISTSSTDIPQSIKDSSTDRVVAYMFLVKQRIDTYKEYLAKSDKAIEDYVSVLDQNKTLYGESY